MAEPKKVKTRVIQKHAQAAVWNNHRDFIPLEGELIVFDKDSSNSYPRLAIGDGRTDVTNLPFIGAEEPLIGSTSDTTPAEVAAAVVAGRPISLTHVDPMFGTLVGNNASITTNGQVVLISCVVKASIQDGIYPIAYELSGDVSTGGWSSTYSILADGEQVVESFIEIAKTLEDTSVALAGKADMTAIPERVSQLDNDANYVTSSELNTIWSEANLMAPTSQYTPSQIIQAIGNGKNVTLFHGDDSDGIVFTGISIASHTVSIDSWVYTISATQTVIEDGKYMKAELLGSTETNTWELIVTELAQKGDASLLPNVTATDDSFNVSITDDSGKSTELELNDEGFGIDFKSENNFTGHLDVDVEHIYFTQDSSSGNTNLDVGPHGIGLTSSDTNGYSQNLDIGPGEAYIDLTDAQLQDHSRLELNFNGLNVQVENEEGSLVDFKVGAYQVTHNGYKLLNTKDHITAGQKSGTNLGIASTAEGAQTTASGNQSHAEGHGTIASGAQAHAEGYDTKAQGKFSHAEGFNTETGESAEAAHAQGKFTKATGDDSAANGYWTIAGSSHQFVIGHANDNKETNLFEIGGGAVYYENSDDYTTADPSKFDRFNVFEVSYEGYAGAERIATKDTIFNRKEGTIKDGVEYARWHNGPTGNVDPIIIPGAVASGFQSVALGGQRIDKALKAYTQDPEIPAEEPRTQALGDQSFAAGGSVIVNGDWSAGFGKEAITYQKAAFATGGGTQAGCTEDEYNLYKTFMHASGSSIPTYANSYSFGHAEGDSSKAIGRATHAEGRKTLAIGFCSHAEGDSSKAIGRYSHTEGYQTVTGAFNNDGSIKLAGAHAHAEGQDTKAYNTATHSEGILTTANGIASHAEGHNTTAGILNRGVDADGKNIIDAAHAEGTSTTASGISSHAEGTDTTASNTNAHAEGISTTASGANSHAEGYTTTASGNQAHAEGSNTTASSTSSHAEGFYSKALANYSHAEGSQSIAAGTQAHAEGYKTLAKGTSSHAEGYSHNQCSSTATIEVIRANWVNNKNFTAAAGQGSHVEGLDTLAYGGYSHAGGSYSGAIGNNSFAHGDHVTASVANQTVFGKYNANDASALFIIGNGDATTSKNAFKVNNDNSITLGNTTLTETDLSLLITWIRDEYPLLKESLEALHNGGII